MHLQPNRNYVSDDDVQTPPELARRIVRHFRPEGRILEPCAGDGHFLRALRAHARQEPSAGLSGHGERLTGNAASIESGCAARLRAALFVKYHGSGAACRAAASIIHSPRLGTGSSIAANVHPTTERRRCTVHWCELKRGRDFFAWREPVDWIVTNPPWSQFRAFLQHAVARADNVVFLVTVNHVWTKARLRDLASANCGVKEIALLDTPANFPPLGFQLGAVHFQRGWRGDIRLTDLRASESRQGQRVCLDLKGGVER